jgi:predicted membrane protein
MKKHNIFWGLLLILTAVLIILNQFGYFAGISIFEIVVTVIMIGIFIVSLIRLNFWGVFFPLAVICIIYAKELNITQFVPWPVLLSAFFLSLGLSLIFNRHTHISVTFGNKYDGNNNVVFEQGGNVINCSTTFGECIKYVDSENFERANIKTVFGDIKLYFDNAKIPSGKAEIFVDIVFGDVDLYIPRDWNIINKTHAVFGDIDSMHNNITPESPSVTIYGNAVFGDLKIIYV